MDAIAWIQQWYETQCDGDWEHQHGVKIETLDNPGWSVAIDLCCTPLEAAEFVEVEYLQRTETDWIRCWVEGEKPVFNGAGGSQNLGEILGIFREWAARVS